tara:strand:- start:38 stop:808 length:771 start_codon:yes stop_codon:yes gene_type:complete
MENAPANEDYSMHNLFLPKVRFDFDDDPDPHKRMKKNMKKAYKMLKPARKLLMPWLPKYNDEGLCCVTGVDLRMLGAEAFDKPLLDPNTLQRMDDRTLLTEFFKDPITKAPRLFTAYSNVDSGVPLRSSYCPDLLQVYWLYSQWKHNSQMEMQGTSSSFLRSRKITMKPMQKKNGMQNRPKLVDELEPFFLKCKQYEGMGVQIGEYHNDETGEVDLVTITLDVRTMRRQANTYASTQAEVFSPQTNSVDTTGEAAL